MAIRTNQELAQAVIDSIKKSGIKKTVLAEKIGLTRQGLDILLKKQSFSLTIDTFYYIHFFRKVNENPKTKIVHLEK